jgi:TRAP transporter TAXI family solute receptor
MRRNAIVILFVAAVVFFSVFSNAQAQVKPGWPKDVSIAGATIGGATFLYSGGFAKLLYDKMGITASVEVTGGSVNNIKLGDNKEVTFTPSQAPMVYDGWHGLDWANGKKYQNIRAVFHMNNTYFQVYSMKKLGLKSIYDLTGKRVGVGEIGGGPNVFYRQILDGLGIKPVFVNAGHSDIRSQLVDGLVHAGASISGIPWVVIKETEASHEANVFGVSMKDVQKLPKFMEHYPFVGNGIIPRGTYRANKDNDIETLTFGSFYYTHKDTAEDFVYEVVKKAFENIDILAAAHPSAREARPESIVYAGAPIHPGALKYYREKGIKIPDSLIAPK